MAQRTVREWKYTGDDYEPGKVLRTIYYGLKDPSAPGPFTNDMLAVRKVLLHFYDEHGKEIQVKTIVPSSSQL